MAELNFFSEDVSFKLKEEDHTKKWIEDIINSESFKLGDLNYIFCSDEFLLKINQEYLNHDTYTDIITFDQSEEAEDISGDIFISIDRIKDNAKKLGVDESIELHRVLVHGVLHLMGHTDATDEEKQAMRKKEEACLSLRN